MPIYIHLLLMPVYILSKVKDYESQAQKLRGKFTKEDSQMPELNITMKITIYTR